MKGTGIGGYSLTTALNYIWTPDKAIEKGITI
jgi:hypothetical protein